MKKPCSPSAPLVFALFLTVGILYYRNVLISQEYPTAPMLRRSHYSSSSPHIQNRNSKTEAPVKFIAESTASPPLNLLKSMPNIPEWYRTKDWGLKKNPKLEKVNIVVKGYDKEEVTAWNHFFFGTTGGLMLEMGAMNGAGSVSHFFEWQAKWRTILIEANPTLASQLPATRPQALNFNLVICDTPRTIHFQDQGDKLSGSGGILEFMSEGFMKCADKIHWLTNGKLDWRKVEADKDVKVVQCLPLVDLLESLEITHVNFFLLDVEGGELNILKGIDFDKISFDVIAVETDRGTDSAELVKEYVNAVTEVMTRNGYQVWKQKVGRNSWFYNKDFVPFNSTSANNPNLKFDLKY